MNQPFRGFFTILSTPFDTSGEILWADLERLADFVCRSGPHGIVWPVNDSEFSLLSFPERIEGFKRIVATVNKRLPVMLGTADTSKQGAMTLSEAAARAGADAVIAMPPWHTKLGTREQIVDYYRAIANASGLPVCIQDFSAPLGSDLSPDTIAEICENVPLVQYIKEERIPQGDWLGAVINRQISGLKSIFGGGICFSMVDLHKRGTAGNIASSGAPDVHARIWNLMEAGQVTEAQRLQTLLNDLMRAEISTQSLHGVKQGLLLRGIFTAAVMRNQAPRTLDVHYVQELQRCLAQLEPYLVKIQS
jgi:dihydrodipicolinate synthase/N-acetylneuraminate lyase